MAIVKGPLGSMEARKQFGHQLIFQHGANGTRVKRYQIPKNPRTIAQERNRIFVGPLTRSWAQMPDYLKNYLNEETGVTLPLNYHSFTAANLQRWNQNLAPIAREESVGNWLPGTLSWNSMYWVNGKLDIEVELTNGDYTSLIGIALLTTVEAELTTKSFTWMNEVTSDKIYTCRLDISNQLPWYAFLWATTWGGVNSTIQDVLYYPTTNNSDIELLTADAKILPYIK